MKVVRDKNQDGIDTPNISMIPLLTSWNITRCNVKGCTSRPNTIICETEAPVFGMCEQHYQEAVKKGKITLQLEFP